MWTTSLWIIFEKLSNTKYNIIKEYEQNIHIPSDEISKDWVADSLYRTVPHIRVNLSTTLQLAAVKILSNRSTVTLEQTRELIVLLGRQLVCWVISVHTTHYGEARR